MTRIGILSLVVLFLAAPAIAQQQQPSSALERVSTSLGQCVGLVERRADEMLELQRQLAAAQARIKEIEAKLPKAD